MKKVKIIGIIILITLSNQVRTQNLFNTTPNLIDCWSDTIYTIYNIKLNNEVSSSFNKTAFINLLTANNVSSSIINQLTSNITLVAPVYPSSVYSDLRKSIVIFSTNKNLSSTLSLISNLYTQNRTIKQPKLAYTPNDYDFYFGFSTINGFSHLDNINAKNAWDITKGDARIKIGIIDNIINSNHPDLVDKVTVFNNYTGTSLFTLTSDHGTAVTGCAVAKTDNKKGISSIGFNTKAIFATLYSGPDIIKTIANQPGVKVIIGSFGFGCTIADCPIDYQTWLNEIRFVNKKLVVFAAGNGVGYCGQDNYWYPSAMDNVVCVSGIGHRDPVGSSIRYNATTYATINWKNVHATDIIGSTQKTHNHHDKVDLVAPSIHIPGLTLNNNYDWENLKTGTSFAAPLVAGTAALIYSFNPCFTPNEVEDILKTTADPSIYTISYNSAYAGKLGTGKLDAYQAVLKALKLTTKYEQNKGYSADLTIDGPYNVRAGYNVTNAVSSGNVVISNGRSIKYKATESVDLYDGFEVQNNANFEIIIQDSPCY